MVLLCAHRLYNILLHMQVLEGVFVQSYASRRKHSCVYRVRVRVRADLFVKADTVLKCI